MTGELPMVRLVLYHPDSIRLLRRALENAHLQHRTMVMTAGESVARELELKRPAEARRHERRVLELKRRLDLVAQLVAQLPDDATPLPAAMGEP